MVTKKKIFADDRLQRFVNFLADFHRHGRGMVNAVIFDPKTIQQIIGTGFFGQSARSIHRAAFLQFHQNIPLSSICMLSIISQIVPSRLQKCGFRSGFRILFGSSFPQSHNNPYAAVINKIIHSIIMPHFQFAFLFLRDTLRIRPSCSMRARGFQNFSVLN